MSAYEVVSRRWDSPASEITETYVFPNGWGLEVVVDLSGGILDVAASARLLAVNPDWVLASNIGQVPEVIPPAPNEETQWLWFTERGQSPDWMTVRRLEELCREVASLPNRVVDLGGCEWFALCDRDATHLEAHPAFPGGVPACDRCASIGK
jgi:hypothetical protein